MHKLILVFVAAAAIPLVLSYSVRNGGDSVEVSDVSSNNKVFSESFKIYNGQRKFAVSMLNELKNREPQANHIFSPHSTYRALLLAFFGAEGNTKDSLKRALFLNWADSKAEVSEAYALEKTARKQRFLDGSVSFNSVDRLFVSKDAELNEKAMSLVEDAIESMDFAADPEKCRDEINKFVEEITKNQIKDLLPFGSVNSVTSVVLTNAAFFKGSWKFKFDKNQTKTEVFKSATPTSVEMMKLRAKLKYGTIDDLDASFVELPYAGDASSISMFVFLPNEDTATAVDDLLGKFTEEALDEAVEGGWTEDVVVEFPKFSLQRAYLMAPTLESMGVENLFGTEADLRGFSETTQFHFDDIIHKAKIEINEEGSTAAAATSTTLRALVFDPIPFKCDHPFLFVIYDKVSSDVLFTGVYRTASEE